MGSGEVPIDLAGPGGSAIRRLAAISFVDIVGYTTLMRSDETRTHKRWMKILSHVIRPEVKSRGGTLVKLTGDGVLVEFPSALQAVEWARDIQRQVIPTQVDPDGAPPTIALRVAVHVGDIMVAESDVFGDGVNVAARLEGHCLPGGVILSEAVYDLVRGAIGPIARDLGLLRLKNVEKPIRAYSVDPQGEGVPVSIRQGLAVDTRSNISLRVPMHFMGRDDALAEIEKVLASGEGRVAITTLHGLRGVGKSTLAVAFAEQHSADYRATWWIRAQTEHTIRADLIALGVQLDWVAVEDKEEPAFAEVMKRLRLEGEGILLIFDNAVDGETLKPHLPRGGATHVIVTSNAHAWRGLATPIEIRLWSKQIGADFLIVRSGRAGERVAAEVLSEALGGLPLAHEQAAAYCERLSTSFAEYLRRLEATPTRLLDDTRHAPSEYRDGMTVAKTFSLAIEEAGKLHPAAEPLIVHAAFMAPEPIPLFLFSDAREKFGTPLAPMLAGDELDQAVAALRTFALVERETIVEEGELLIVSEAIRLHRLVRQMAVVRRQGEAREDVRRALIEVMAAIYPRDVYLDLRCWPRARRLYGLALELVGGEGAPPKGAEAAVSFLLDRLGMYNFRVLGAFAQARPLYERALAIRETTAGPDHASTGESLHALARTLHALGDSAGARSLYERSLAILDKAYGPENPVIVQVINHLADVLQSEGEFAKAQLLYERALAICEKAFGLEHSDTGWCFTNIGNVLHAQGELAKARSFLDRAVAICERTLGPEHPTTADSLNALAVLLHAQGEFTEARPVYERALAIREMALGPEHPSTALSLNNLAHLLLNQGEFAGARALLERALAIRKKKLGSEHPTTADSLNALAVLLHAQGEFTEARPVHERALAIREKALGPEHPSTALSLNNLACLLLDQGEFGGARALFERALAIRKKKLGSEHLATAASLDNLARLLHAEGDLAAARPIFEFALVIREKSLGPDHYATGWSLNNLARLLHDQGHFAAARPLYERAVAIQEKVFGPEGTDLATALNNLADLLNDTGDSAEAELLFHRAMAIGEKKLGSRHPLTQRYRCCYARLLLKTERSADALTLAKSALDTHEATSGPNHPWTKDSVRVTADALEAVGRTDEASVLRSKYSL